MQEVAEEIKMALPVPGKPKARGAFVLELNRQLVDCAQSEKKKAKEPMSKLSFRLPGSSSCVAESCVSTVVMVVGGEPRRISVRIGDYPGASQERRVKNGLAPLEGNFGAYCYSYSDLRCPRAYAAHRIQIHLIAADLLNGEVSST
jgi:hypothetical protein